MTPKEDDRPLIDRLQQPVDQSQIDGEGDKLPLLMSTLDSFAHKYLDHIIEPANGLHLTNPSVVKSHTFDYYLVLLGRQADDKKILTLTKIEEALVPVTSKDPSASGELKSSHHALNLAGVGGLKLLSDEISPDPLPNTRRLLDQRAAFQLMVRLTVTALSNQEQFHTGPSLHEVVTGITQKSQPHTNKLRKTYADALEYSQKFETPPIHPKPIPPFPVFVQEPKQIRPTPQQLEATFSAVQDYLNSNSS